ncbi:hypothetical protein SRB5_34850 [Streptomyces sp. RB5]|uniref:Uncharacterized protein n=1 Tax=Streptomyces smaragdinus TaxID=2585196 RepID=A0A7K0CIM5_9ACTN|nr:hypothetical protein [Streptomyces smaragdinus]MQY13340.1 hypothetical protein [Streptomyces smaragdinus]
MSTPQQPQDPRIPVPPATGAGTPPVPPRTVVPTVITPSDGPPVSGASIPPSVPQPPPPAYREPQPYQPAQGEPDWSAMADEYNASQKRRKWVLISLTAVAVLAIAAGAIFFLPGSDKDDEAKKDDPVTQEPKEDPTSGPEPTTSKSGKPAPAATMLGKDLFTAKTLPANGKTYDRLAVSHSDPCWKGTRNGLGPLLNKNKCRQVLTATYASGDHAVTVGVAVFDNAAEAAAVATNFTGQLRPLAKNGKPGHCADEKVPCAVTKAAHGLYVYTTIAGPTSGKAGDKDPDSVAAGNAVAAYALSRLLAME